jgi:hypothetical protein
MKHGLYTHWLISFSPNSARTEIPCLAVSGRGLARHRLAHSSWVNKESLVKTLYKRKEKGKKKKIWNAKWDMPGPAIAGSPHL